VFDATITEACPLAPLTALLPPGKVALAPFAGAANVTFTPLRGLPALSVTVATRGMNDVPTAALCPEPLVAVMISEVPVIPLLPPQPIIEKTATRTRATTLLCRFMTGGGNYTRKYTFGQPGLLMEGLGRVQVTEPRALPVTSCGTMLSIVDVCFRSEV
jgi:hypothetical protein